MSFYDLLLQCFAGPHYDQNLIRNVLSRESLFTTSPLHFAVMLDRTGMIELLIKHGIELNSVDSMGDTPLTIALKRGHISTAGFLIEQKADVNMVAGVQCTPLGLAIKQGEDRLVKRLIHAGALLNEISYHKPPLLSATTRQDTYVVDLLLRSKADVNIRHAEGSALNIATFKGYNAIVRRLLKEPSICVDVKDPDGHTPLYWAYMRRDYGIVELLLSAGARFDSDYGIFDTQQQALSWTVACGYFHVHPKIKRAMVVLLLCAKDEHAEHPLCALSGELLCMLVAEINTQIILGV